MSQETIERVRVNIPKFKQVRGERSHNEFSEITGVSPQMLGLIEKGKRWQSTLARFAEFCERTKTEPNAYFEIVKKLS